MNKIDRQNQKRRKLNRKEYTRANIKSKTVKTRIQDQTLTAPTDLQLRVGTAYDDEENIKLLFLDLLLLGTTLPQNLIFLYFFSIL